MSVRGHGPIVGQVKRLHKFHPPMGCLGRRLEPNHGRNPRVASDGPKGYLVPFRGRTPINDATGVRSRAGYRPALKSARSASSTSSRSFTFAVATLAASLDASADSGNASRSTWWNWPEP